LWKRNPPVAPQASLMWINAPLRKARTLLRSRWMSNVPPKQMRQGPVSYPVRAEKMDTIWKRSILLHGRKTSVSLEEPFWRALRMIAKERKTTVGALVDEIDSARGQSRNLSSAIRIFVLAYYVSLEKQGAPPHAADISAPERMSG